MNDKCERCGKTEEENERLKRLMLEHLFEITSLKNEIRYLRQELKNKQVGEQENRLILLAKDIIRLLDPEDPQ
ncbi:hypothetical protein [Paenibacillus sp. IHBB 10380]|uniref:hypothetical protein n=1 Tax=Paenibacillus sp. IHBB 10380 TaxID=1566358 RepID=UPI0005CFAB08|nr:hypothetical protein [Paenibacillus sp. IHBB 10380]AJS58498.1 hypothetical protein UB51_08335 [Paenibacillus sp. IHBB 10380]